MNTKLLSIVLGLAVLGSLASFYLSRHHKSETPKFTLRDVELYSHVDPDELHYRVSLFNDWTKEHNKQYSAEEAAIRFHTWNENYEAVEDHNSRNLSWTLEMNLFADLTSEEFGALYLGYRPDLYDQPRSENEEEEHNLEEFQDNQVETTDGDSIEAFEENGLSKDNSDEGNLQDGIDWRTKGAVTIVKNQGQCGSCYAFATVHALEGLRWINQKKLQALSPQQIVDCSTADQGCNGGLMTNSFEYTRRNGISSNKAYPYKNAKGRCQGASPVYRHSGFQRVKKNSGTALKNAVQNQPVAVAVSASQRAFQLYKQGIITGSSCGTRLDHAITAVGYSDNASNKHWIAKNQCGTSWGEKGYVRIGYSSDGPGVCGINSDASYPTK